MASDYWGVLERHQKNIVLVLRAASLGKLVLEKFLTLLALSLGICLQVIVFCPVIVQNHSLQIIILNKCYFSVPILAPKNSRSRPVLVISLAHLCFCIRDHQSHT